MTDYVNKWASHYADVERTLENMANVRSVATAFNTNIDAVIKISGKKLAIMADKLGVSWEELNRIDRFSLEEPIDVIKGIFRCFSKGIAEEWLANRLVYDFMVENIGFDRLQMGGQGGIVANVMAVCGVKHVYNHCGSLPAQQALLFLDKENLFSFDEKGKASKAREINRKKDVPLIHWIIEFDRGDEFVLKGHSVVCPKANRFIATYDPLNSKLVMDNAFVAYLKKNPVDVVILSGYHPLTAEQDGEVLVENSLPIVEDWQKRGSMIHLEIASTQDALVRKAVVEKIASRVASIGLNERETIDVLQVIGEDDLAQCCEKNTEAVNLFKAILRIKQKVGCKRVQLHMFGMYLTIQDEGFDINPLANRRGMCLAAVVAAGKAGKGQLNDVQNLTWAAGKSVCQQGVEGLKAVGEYIHDAAFAETGIGKYEGFDIIAVPTILVENPVTLVGMGDTISSVSFVGAVAVND